MKKVSIEQEKEIVQAYSSVSSTVLAEKYGVAASTIRNIWQKNGCTGKKQQKLFLPNEQEFIQLYKEKPMKELEKYYGKSKTTINNYAKKIGVYKSKSEILTSKQREEIEKAYCFKTATALAEKYGVKKSTISGVWYRAGLSGKINRTYYQNDNYFEQIDSDEKAYWVGFIAADGCIYKPKDTRQDILSITLQASDKKHLEKFLKAIESEKKIRYIMHGKDRKYSGINIQISSNKMSRDLEKIGVISQKTYNMQWPKIKEELIPAYIRGYFDGDGTISKNFEINTLHKVNIGISGFEENLNHFKIFLSKFNIKTNFSPDLRENKQSKKTNQLFGTLIFTSKKDKANFLHLIYDNATVFLDRKKELADKFLNLYNKNSISWNVKTKEDMAVLESNF